MVCVDVDTIKIARFEGSVNTVWRIMLVKTQETTFEHPEMKESAYDLAVASSRQLFLAVTITGGMWVLILSLARAGQISIEILPIMALIAFSYYLVNWLTGRNLVRAQVVWLILYGVTILTALFIFRLADIAYLLALTPLMAAVMIGWRAAFLTGLGILVTLFGMNYQFGEGMLSMYQVGLVGLGSVLAGVVGWSAMSPILTMVGWTNYSYRMARENLEESRNQRLELAQTQHDLVMANKELVRLTNSLKVMTYKAEEARRVKEEFVANVSHELRTPLNMIIGYTNLIIKSPSGYGKRLPARLLADISSIQRNSQHLVSLINDVLDLSQVDAGRMALARDWTPVKEIIESAVSAVQPLYISKQLYLKKELPEDDFLVYCDETRIREVVLNLLSNAGRFTEQGGVTVSAGREGGNLVVRVTDTGPGISSEDQQRIFEPFQQLDPLLHHRVGGSGLGLTISKRFVEMHEGEMWLESRPGEGTTFFFSIPLEPVITVEESRSTEAGRWINPLFEYKQRNRPSKAPRPEYLPRIVVVEEDESVKRILERNLEKVDIISGSSLVDVANQIGEGSIQLLILNQPSDELPLDLNQYVSSQTPVISCWIPGREEAARRLGVREYLLKPTPQEILLETLDKIANSGLSILMVDDDLETLQLYARILSVARPDYRTIRAASGDEALVLMRERRPDVVILDLTLPGMSGFDVLKEKSLDPAISSIPVIVISSTDPLGIPVMTDHFKVSRPAGITTREFLDCMSTINDCLNTYSNTPHPAQPESVPGRPVSLPDSEPPGREPVLPGQGWSE